MQLWKEITLLLRKEITLEWRQRYAISGILLYVLSTVFIVYVSFVQVEPVVWVTLFWIIVLFASVNAIVKSFQQENSERQIYYYLLARPEAVLLAKILYNSALLLLLSVLTFGAFSFVAGLPVQDLPLYFLTLFLGSIGFSITLTFVSAVAAKASNAATLMAILSFPLIIPILLTLIRLSLIALQGDLVEKIIGPDVLILVAIDLFLLGFGFFLFPFLWRD